MEFGYPVQIAQESGRQESGTRGHIPDRAHFEPALLEEKQRVGIQVSDLPITPAIAISYDTILLPLGAS